MFRGCNCGLFKICHAEGFCFANVNNRIQINKGLQTFVTAYLKYWDKWVCVVWFKCGYWFLFFLLFSNLKGLFTPQCTTLQALVTCSNPHAYSVPVQVERVNPSSPQGEIVEFWVDKRKKETNWKHCMSIPIVWRHQSVTGVQFDSRHIHCSLLFYNRAP